VRSANPLSAKLAAALAVFFFIHPIIVSPQEPSDTIRITTQLVQTDVLVLNKNGEFVDGLKPEQFALRVNDRTRTLSSFDRVSVGSASEEEKLAAARGHKPVADSAKPDRGRTILFYLDDYHLSTNSITRTREMLKTFVDKQMALDDEVALVTATGQLGFLEQFAAEPAVILRAIDKLAHRSFSSSDAERTPMSESEAAAIAGDDRRVVDYFVDQLLREMGQRPRGISTPLSKTRTDAETVVKSRARSIIDQSTSLSVATLSGLEKLVRLTSPMPWRKTLFFVSDGFMIHNPTNPGLDLRRITSAAAQSATVIYSVDAQGLITGVQEASRKTAFNYGRTSGANSNAISAAQQPLHSLAEDSAGKAILNTNEPGKDLERALGESANYYLLSWRPDEKDINHGFQSIEINIVGRPDLVVRVRHGYLLFPSAPEKTAAKKNSGKKKNDDPERPLVTALRGLAPNLDLPVSLSVGYTDIVEKTLLVTATVEVPLEALTAGAQTESRELDLIGVSIDERGRSVETFEQSLTVKASEIQASKSSRVLYNHQIKLPPGLHQIRVAVQERGSNRIGTAMEWIEVPDWRDKPFSLSSLFVGEVDSNAMQTGKLSVNASHRFRSGSTLGFFVVIYNPYNSANSDVALQVQVFRDDQPVITKPLVKVPPNGQPSAIPYGEDLVLADLPAGRYVLQITAIDRIAKKSTLQRARFVVY
jgi:VWFA-related protein